MPPDDLIALPHRPRHSFTMVRLLPIAARAAVLFVFWVVLIASGPSRPAIADLVAGAVVAACATWVSVKLLP